MCLQSNTSNNPEHLRRTERRSALCRILNVLYFWGCRPRQTISWTVWGHLEESSCRSSSRLGVFYQTELCEAVWGDAAHGWLTPDPMKTQTFSVPPDLNLWTRSLDEQESKEQQEFLQFPGLKRQIKHLMNQMRRLLSAKLLIRSFFFFFFQQTRSEKPPVAHSRWLILKYHSNTIPTLVFTRRPWRIFRKWWIRAMRHRFEQSCPIWND